MLRADQLACERGDRRLFAGVNFTLKAGQWLHLQGANGSGKTSLMRQLATLSRPANGQVLWHGQKVDEVRDDYLRDMFYWGHLPALKADLSAFENVCLSLSLAGQAPDAARVVESLAFVGLSSRADLPAGSLSAGQQRRVTLAGLRCRAPRLWLLDEPFTSLDVAGVSLLLGLMRAHLEGGGSVVMSSHVPVDLPKPEVLAL